MLVIPTFDDPRIGNLLRGGAIGVIPTDTTYCVVVSAANSQAVQQVYRLTGRTDAPGVLLAAATEDLEDLGFDAAELEPADEYWPAAIDVELKTPQGLQFLDFGKGTITARVPDSDSLDGMLSGVGPILAVEANPAGQPLATSLQLAERYFGEQVDFYVGGSDRSSALPATLVKFNGENIQVLRAGAVTINADGTIANVGPPADVAAVAPVAPDGGTTINLNSQAPAPAPVLPPATIATAPAGVDSGAPIDIPMEGGLSLRPSTVITPTTNGPAPEEVFATPPPPPAPDILPPSSAPVPGQPVSTVPNDSNGPNNGNVPL